jgi:hypothetical protein
MFTGQWFDSEIGPVKFKEFPAPSRHGGLSPRNPGNPGFQRAI